MITIEVTDAKRQACDVRIKWVETETYTWGVTDNKGRVSFSDLPGRGTIFVNGNPVAQDILIEGVVRVQKTPKITKVTTKAEDTRDAAIHNISMDDTAQIQKIDISPKKGRLIAFIVGNIVALIIFFFLIDRQSRYWLQLNNNEPLFAAIAGVLGGVVVAGLITLYFHVTMRPKNNQKPINPDTTQTQETLQDVKLSEANKKPNSNIPAKAGISSQTGWFRALGTGVVVAVVVILVIPARTNLSSALLASAVAGLIVAGLLVLYLDSTGCPECKRWLVDKETSVVPIDSRKGYKTVEREEKNRNGDVIRKWNEQVRVKTVTYHHHHECQNCGHQWIVTKEKEFDTFND